MQVRHRRCAFYTDQEFMLSTSHLHGFLFICTLHLCKHCTVVLVAPNLRKLTITALCVNAAEALVCRSVTVVTHFAPTQGLYFQALHLLNFHFICTLH